jgi:hypothetical protein
MPAAIAGSSFLRKFLQAQVLEKQIFGLPAACPPTKNAVLCLHEA